MDKKKDERDNRLRVHRGGCWRYDPLHARVAYRNRLDPGYQVSYLGLRLVRYRSALEWLAESLREVTDE